MIALVRWFQFADNGPRWLWAIVIAAWLTLAVHFVLSIVMPDVRRRWRGRRG